MTQRVTVTGVSLHQSCSQGRVSDVMRVHVLAKLDTPGSYGAGFATVVKKAPPVLFDAAQAWRYPCEMNIEVELVERDAGGMEELIRSMRPVGI